MFILATERLHLREMDPGDRAPLAAILQDAETMWAYEHAFSDAEVREWLERQIERYARDGHGLWAVLLGRDGPLIGQCGLTWQDWGERRILEVGYLFNRAYWRQGYATEAARACRDYAFDTLGAPAVYSIIRDDNWASRRVAERNGMTVCGELIKHYQGKDLPHLVYRVKKDA